MTKINLSINAEKADIKAQYIWAVNRLQEIVDETSWTNAKVITAVQDEAKIQLKLLKRLRQLSEMH